MVARSKISQMPPQDRDWLNAELASRGFADYEELSNLLKARGYEISHAAVHRHGQQLQRRLEAIQTSTEFAKAIVDAAPDQADKRSEALISLVQTGMFNAIVDFQEADLTNDPVKKVKLYNNAAIGLSMLVKSSLAQKQWADEVAAKLDELAKNSGKNGVPKLDPATIQYIRQNVYGS